MAIYFPSAGFCFSQIRTEPYPYAHTTHRHPLKHHIFEWVLRKGAHQKVGSNNESNIDLRLHFGSSNLRWKSFLFLVFFLEFPFFVLFKRTGVHLWQISSKQLDVDLDMGNLLHLTLFVFSLCLLVCSMCFILHDILQRLDSQAEEFDGHRQ